jgi:hypothetical protein
LRASKASICDTCELPPATEQTATRLWGVHLYLHDVARHEPRRRDVLASFGISPIGKEGNRGVRYATLPSSRAHCSPSVFCAQNFRVFEVSTRSFLTLAPPPPSIMLAGEQARARASETKAAMDQPTCCGQGGWPRPCLYSPFLPYPVADRVALAKQFSFGELASVTSTSVMT